MSKNCSLVPEAAALDIYLLLATNKNITVDQFTSGLVDIVFKESDVRSDIADYEVGEVSSKFGEYLRGLIGIAKPVAGTLSVEDLNADYTALDQRPIDLINMVGQAVKHKVAAEEASAKEVAVEDLWSDEAEANMASVAVQGTDEETSTVEGTALPVETVATSLDIAEDTAHSVGMPISVFAARYFNNPPELLNLYDNFGKFFMNLFSEQLVDNSLNGTGFNGEFEDVLRNLHSELQVRRDAGLALLQDVPLNQLPQQSREVQEAYYAAVAYRQFFNVSSIFLPGVTWNKETVKVGDSVIRKAFASYDGSFSGLDNVSDLLKMYLYTTPLLKSNPDGTFSQNPLKGYLNVAEVKAVANELNIMPRDLRGFEVALEKKANQPGPARDVYVSLYNRFFNPNPYQVGDKVLESYSAIARRQAGSASSDSLQNILSSLITAFSSMENLEHFIAENSKVDVSRTTNIDVAAVVQENYLNNLVNPNDRTALSNQVLKNISVHEDADGFFIKVGKNIRIKYDLTNHNLDRPNAGVLVNISPDTKEQLEEPNTAARALSLLGFPSYIDNRFTSFYRDNIEDHAPVGGGDVSLSNMIANMAFVTAMNIPEAREKMAEFGNNFVIPEHRALVTGASLLYPPLEMAYAFKDILTYFSEQTEGITVKKFRRDGSGNLMPVTGVKSRIYDTANKMRKLADTPDTIHKDNVMVKKHYTLEGWAAKDGITVYGQRKSNAEMSSAEQFKFLIEDGYLRFSAQNRFEKAIFQPGVMADRSLVEMAICKKGSEGSEFLPLHWNAQLDNGMRPLQYEFVRSERGFHHAMAEKIVGAWNAVLPTLGHKVEFKTIEELDAYLHNAKIPFKDIQGTNLVLEAQYVPFTVKQEDGTKTKYAGIKAAFLEMHNIFMDDAKAKAYTNKMFFEFKRSLAREGYTADTLSEESLGIVEERLGIRNNANMAFDALITSYFYQSNIMSSAIMNVNMGSVYQFKGDLDLDSVKTQADLYRNRLEVAAQNNPELTPEEIDKRVQKVRKSLALDRAMNDMFVQQAKRNAGLGSGFQHPRLASQDEKGFLMDAFTTTALISDPEVAVQLLGKLGKESQEVYDAAQFAHPLYFIKLNNSLGNQNSGYINKGGAVKDISNEVDPVTGIVRFQKKATFNQFSHELLREGSPELHRLFTKMNSVPFSEFGAEPLTTAKGTFNNLQELWEAHGGLENPNSWQEVAVVLGQSPKHRAAYIEKVGFKSGEKTGNRAFNDATVWQDDAVTLKWTPFSNEHHGVILNADHDPDSTHTDEAEKSLMTQVISAVAFQGESKDIADQINSALESLSEAGLEGILSSIQSEAMSLIRADGLAKRIEASQVGMFNSLWDKAQYDQEAFDRLQSELKASGYLDRAGRRWVTKITKEAVSKQEPFGIVSSLLDAGALDTLQVQNVMHRSIMSEFNRQTTRVKFKGQEFVVSASYHFNRLYTLPNGAVVNRSGYLNSDLTEYEAVTAETLKLLTPADKVFLNNVSMTFAAASKLIDPTNPAGLLAKVPVESRPLKWMGYRDANGVMLDAQNPDGTYVYPEYGDLLNNNNPELHPELELRLINLMNDSSKGWQTEDAEFFMPMTHLKYFNLDNPLNPGEPGTHYGQPISIQTIMGEDLGGGEIYVKNGLRISAPEFGSVTISGNQLEAMKEFFTERIELHEDRYPLHNYDEVELKTGQQVADLKNNLSKALLKLDHTGIEFGYLSDQLDILNKVILGSDLTAPVASTTAVELNNRRASQRAAYIEVLAEKQALAFPKTLEIIAARIPAQGKQSFVAGQVRGFITSNRNALYGAPEMLTITGADHDIDKSHVLVYSLRPDGSLYSYTPFIDGGKISKAKFEEHLRNKITERKAILEALGREREDIEKAIDKLKKAELREFKEATKNFVLDKLRESIRDPRNAVEAATPVSMRKLQEALAARNDGKIDIDDEEGGVIFADGTISSPYNPASIPLLEIVNSTGKQLVGVNATGLKGYAAIFTAVLKDADSPYFRFHNELNNLFVNEETPTVPKVVEEVFAERYGKDENGNLFADNSLNLYVPVNGKLVRRSSERIANTGRFSEKERDNENKWRGLQAQWKQEGLSDAEIDSRLLQESAYLFDKQRKLEPQAWEDISELLSAATDNAKELLLGRLGITSDTNGFVVAGIVAGFDLADVLALLGDSEVQNIIKDVNAANDTVVAGGRPTTLIKALKAYVENKYQYITNSVNAAALAVDTAKKNLAGETLYADAVRLRAGVSSLDEAAIVYAGTSSLTAVPMDTIHSEEAPLTIEEEAELQALLGDSFGRLALPKAGAILRALKGANTILVTDNLSPAQEKLVMSFARNVRKPVYKMSTAAGSAAWKISMAGQDFVHTAAMPVIGQKTALILGQSITAGKAKLLNATIANTRLALSEPEAYDATVEQKEKDRTASYDSAVATLNKILDDYVGNGPRQILELIKISGEMRAVSSMLAINQSIPNSDWDGFNFINKFTMALNEQIPDGEPTFTNGDIIEFINNVSQGKTTEAQIAIDRYERSRVAINPLYVLAQNRHYFGYIKSFLFAQDLINSSSFTNKTMWKLFEEHLGVVGMTEEKWGSVKNFIHGIAVEQFFTKRGGDFTINDQTYNLSQTTGRVDFLRNMTDIVRAAQYDNTLKDNPFIQSLKIEPSRDAKLDDYIEIIRTLDLNKMDETRRAILELGLNQLRDSDNIKHKVLHDALFFYSLITNKGARGSKSFSSLFGLKTPVYSEYVDFMVRNGEELHETVMTLAKEMTGAPLSLSTGIIAERSTMGKRAVEWDGEVFITNKPDLAYTLPKKLREGVFRSKETGNLYAWDAREFNGQPLGYVAITAKYPLRAIPYTKGAEGLEAAGFKVGVTTKINNEGDTIQLLKYDFGAKAYIAETPEGNLIHITGEELLEFNTDMVFLGNRFGKITMEESANAKFQRIKEEGKPEYWNLKLNPTIQAAVAKGTVKYRLINEQDLPDGVMVGQTIGSTVLTSQGGIRVKLKYHGMATAKDSAIWMGLAPGTKTNRFRSGEIGAQHVVEYDFTSVPEELEGADVEVSMHIGKVLNARTSANLLNQKVTHFITSKNLRLEEGETRLTKVKVGDRHAWFKVTNVGALEVASRTIPNLTSKLGYSADGAALVNRWIEKGGQTVYEVEPYNAKAASTNSHLEYKFLGDEITPNLTGSFGIITLGQYDNTSNAKLRAEALAYGLSNEDIEEEVMDVLNAEGKALKAKTEEFKDMFEESVISNQEINAVMKADMVIVVDDFLTERSPNYQKRLKKAGLTLQNFSQDEQQLLDLVQGETDDELISSLEDLREKIRTGRLGNNINHFKALTNNSGRLMNLISVTLNKLYSKSDVPVELKTATFTSTALTTQAAKYAGKPLYIYAPDRQQWFKYDAASGELVASRIPVATGKVAIFNHDATDRLAAQATASLFKKTSAFRQLQVQPMGKIITVGDLTFGETEPNAETNLVVSNDTAAILSGVTSFKDLDRHEPNASNTSYVFYAQLPDGSKAYENDFVDFEDAEVRQYADGAVSIKSGNYFWTYFPDQALADKYHLEGKTTKENFKIKLGDTYYVFDKLTRMDEDAFAFRDQLLDEKAELKRLFDEAQAYGEEFVAPLYAKARFADNVTADRYKNYNSLDSFMLHLMHKTLPGVDATLSKELTAVYLQFQAKKNAAWDYFAKVMKENDGNTFNYRSMEGSFFNMQPTANDIPVFFTDNAGLHAHVDMRIKSSQRAYLQKGKYGQQKVGDELRGFALPVATLDTSGKKRAYQKIEQAVLNSSVLNLVKLADANKDKTFYVEVPTDMHAGVYDAVTGGDVNIMLGKAFSSIKRSIPENIVFTNGGLRTRGVQRTTPFTVTDDATDLSAVNIGHIDLWRSKIGESTMAGLWNLERGYPEDADAKEVSPMAPALKGSSAAGMQLRQAYKQLWRRWAEANPRAFEKLAMSIRNKAIYDPFMNGELSTAKVLAELMTEKFIDNSWLDYPSTFVPGELLPEQTMLPVENFVTFPFTTISRGGKAMVHMGNKAYIATIEKLRVSGDERLNVSTVRALGLENEADPIKVLDEKYPFMKDGGYALVSLTEFRGELKATKAQPEGHFATVLASSNLEVSAEHMALAEKATAVLGIDTRARITDTLDKSMTGTSWIKDYKGVLGDGLFLDPSPTDAVWIYGSTLEDGNTPETIQGVIESTKVLIDRYLRAGSDILIGKSTGVEEEIRSYIAANYPDYTQTETGYTLTLTTEVKYNANIGKQGQLFKVGTAVGRFNMNNVVAREGNNLTGAWGTILYTSPEAANEFEGSGEKSLYSVNIDSAEIADWNSVIDHDVFIGMLNSLGLEEGDNAFESIRGTLLVTEQRFMRNLISASLLRKHGVAEVSTLPNTDGLDSLIAEVTDPESSKYNPTLLDEYSAAYEKVFNPDGTFKVSDAGALAMSRNRATTIAYAKELLPEIFELGFGESPLFAFVNKERATLDKGRGYFDLVNSPTIGKNTLRLLAEAQNVTYRDAYNVLKTFGTDKVFTTGSAISGVLVNKLFVEAGVKAFTDGDKLIVLDNDAINHNRSGRVTKYDRSTKPVSAPLHDAEAELAKVNSSVYRYLKSKRLMKIDPYAAQIRVTLGTETKRYPATPEGVRDLVRDVRTDVGMSYFSKLEGITMTPEYMEAILKNKNYSKLLQLVNTHIKSNRLVDVDNFSRLFNGEAQGTLPNKVRDLIPGTVYTGVDGMKSFVMKDADDQWFAQSASGALYYLLGTTWKAAEGINNQESSFMGSLVHSLATPKGIGRTFSLLGLAGGEQIQGEFEVSETKYSDGELSTSEIIATDYVTDQKYRWETMVEAWVAVDAPAFAQTEANTDFIPVPGHRVMALPLVGGNSILLSNGKALSEEHVVDDRGEYMRTANGTWEQTLLKGGFQNPEVKYQKQGVEFTDVDGTRLKSKVVGPEVMRAVFRQLFDNAQIEAELLSAEDIKTIYGKKYASTSGFVLDGKIVINLDKATLDTPLHEFGGHIYMNHLKTVDPEAYMTIVEQCLEHPMAEKIAVSYPELDKEGLGEEVFSTLFGLVNQEKLNEQSLTAWQKIKKLANEAANIKDFFKGLFQLAFGTRQSFELNLEDSLMDIMHKLGDDLIFNPDSALRNLSAGELQQVKDIMNPQRNIEDIVARLKDLGYIQTLCK